ncbi:MAG: hypothetical protein R3A79_31130 [Nannocystaceae bacterium]
MTGTPRLDRLLRGVIRRQRIAEAAALLARVALPAGLLVAAAAIVAARRLDAPIELAWLAALPVPLTIAWATLRPRPRRIAARRADAHFDLDDRLGNALELAAAPPPSDPQSAAIVGLIVAEAEELAADLDPRPVVSLRPPGLRALDLAAFAALALALLVPPPEPPRPPLDPSDRVEGTDIEARPTPPADRHLLEPLRQDLKRLGEREDAAAELAAAMLDVLDAFARGELDREAAFAQLEALESELAAAEAAFEAGLDEDPGLLAEGVRELSLALEQEDLTAMAGERFARGEGDEAADALEKAGEQAEASAADSEALDRALKAAEKALGKAASEGRDTAAELAEAERRLKKQQKQKEQGGAEDPEEEERRLKKQEEKVEQLRRQHEREKAAQRALEQLRRDAQQARGQGQQGGQKGDKGQSQGSQGGQRGEGQKRALERLSRGAAGATKKSQGSRRLGQARDGLEEAKNFIRRSGKKGSQGDTRKEQMERFSKAAKGKRGDKGDKGDKGQKGPTLLVEGDVGDGPPDMLIEGDGQDGQSMGAGDGQGDGQGDGDGEGGQALGADGIGSGTQDPLGEASRMRVRPRDVKVDPKHGRGATRAEVISTASQEGFASASYLDVFTDYHGFAQSALDREELPAGQRRQIKRYFRLIQPR